MHVLILVTLCASTFMDFAAESKTVPAVLKFTPEMLTMVFTVAVLLRALRGDLAVIPAKYWFVFGLLTFIIICGVLTNSVGAGPTLAGMRYYLRAIPMFFVPAIANFSARNLRQQLKLIVGIGLVQVPVAMYQRWVVMSEGRFTGDDVRGTLMDSGVLSIFLICAVVVLTAFFMRGQLRRWPFLLLFFVLLFPTTIDETKATIIFLPLGLLTTIIAASPPGKRLKILAGGTVLLASFAAILIPIYAAMNSHGITKERQEGLLEFFSSEKQVSIYLNDKKDIGLGTKRLVGRGTAIKFPLQYLARDPVHLAFGLGIGNASHSALGEAFTGEYYDLFQYFVVSAAAAFLLEIGVMGTALVFLLYWFVYSDALAVLKSDTDATTGAIAAGWIGVVCVMGLATFYNVTHAQVSLSYLFWYFTGVIVARRGQLLLSKHQSRVANLRGAAA